MLSPRIFVEDFTWIESTKDSSLDRNNGRFCVTPDFPNGTYAYFATIDTLHLLMDYSKDLRDQYSHI